MNTKKILAMIVSMILLGGMLGGCGGNTIKTTSVPTTSIIPFPITTSVPTPTQIVTPTPTTSGGYELTLVTDLGTIDDKSFNQGAWEGLVKYATENNITNKYYQPTEQSDDAYLASIDLAVKGGAKIVVTPGFLFEKPIWEAQTRYPNVNFILIDGQPHPGDYNVDIRRNTVGVTYAEEQAGYLAGYAAVKDGYRALGFIGGVAVPAVIRYGYGFIQGADAAAIELGLHPGQVTINYNYSGVFVPTQEVQTMASSWYSGGTEVIFSCGGGIASSVIAAAEASGKKIIGVDVDQSGESNVVITSAMKELKNSVYDCIADYYKGTFPGGQHLVFSAENNGVGLPMTTSKFKTFSQADYDNIFAKLKANEIYIVGDLVDGNPVNITDLPTRIVKVSEF